MADNTVQTPLSLLVTCPKGIEGLLAEELSALGVTPGKTTLAGVYATASHEAAYRVCLWSRLANRVIVILAYQSLVDTAQQLHEAAAAVQWGRHLINGKTLSVDFHGRSDHVRHTRFGAQTVKDGVVEALSRAGQVRPVIDTRAPDARLYAHLHRQNLTLGIDLAGDSLHRRGYRQEVGHAPMKENLAAALLIRAGWPARARAGEPLIDPLCGAGTLVIEAALMAADQAPNLHRERFGLHGWAQLDEALWATLRQEAGARASIGRKRCRNRIYGHDQSPAAISAARANAMRAGIPALIEFVGQSVENMHRPESLDAASGLIICNPPYGERLGELPALVSLYASLGEAVKALFPGWLLALFTANPDLGHRLGMRAYKQHALKNGPLDARLLLMQIGSNSVSNAESRAADASPDASTAPSAVALNTAASDAPQTSEPVVGESSDAPAKSGQLAGDDQNVQMLVNRLHKNQKRLRKWLKQTDQQCYRLYDADMPEYALAIDIYAGQVHVQEYAAPRSVNPAQAQKRLFDALEVLPATLGVSPGKIHVKRRERQSGKDQYQKRGASGERFAVQEGPARLWVNLRDYLDTGLFLDHRPVRRLIGEMAEGKRFLNLFCYTASATVHAALGGASDSISVDMSNTYLGWAQDNLALNGLDARRHRVVRDDCLHWLETATTRFDLIFMDPPTFSNSKKMRDSLDIQRDHSRLIRRAMARLAPGGTLVFSNNQRRFSIDSGLTDAFEVQDISTRTFDPDFQRRTNLHHVFLIRHRECA